MDQEIGRLERDPFETDSYRLDQPNTTLSTPELRERVHHTMTEARWSQARAALDELSKRRDIATPLPPLSTYQRAADLHPEYRALLQDRIDLCNSAHLRQHEPSAPSRGSADLRAPMAPQLQRPENERATVGDSPISLEGLSLRDLGAIDAEGSFKTETLAALRTGKGGHENFAAEFATTGRVKEYGSEQGIQVEIHDAGPYLRDGRNRLKVARENGRETLYGQVYDGPREPGKKPIFEGEIPIAPRALARTFTPSTVIGDRYELDRFKREIDLTAFAASRGYSLDKRESSVSTRVMRHAGTHDKIIIGKAPDGHWQYFSVRDREDNGTIVDFIQRRERKNLGEVRRELREWTHTERELPAFARTPVELATKDRVAVALEVARAAVVETHPYLEARGLTRETLGDPRFRGTWRQASGPHGNVMFLHHDSKGLSGCEIKNRGFTGFSKGGDKGLWSSVSLATDDRLVVAESAIDALSYHQVNPHPKTRYVSFGGGQNPEQPALLERAISWMPARSTIVAATDKDRDGDAFAARLAELCAKHPHVTFERHAPKLGKDWNDHLRALRSPSLSPRLEPAKSMGLER